MNFKALKIIDSALEGGDKDIDLYGKGIDEASFKYLLNKEGIEAVTSLDLRTSLKLECESTVFSH